MRRPVPTLCALAFCLAGVQGVAGVAAGEQSAIAERNAGRLPAVKRGTDDLATIARVVEWKRGFRNVSGGGRHVGARTVDEILESGVLTGCHDHGLLLAAVLRAIGFEAMMLDAAGIGWARLAPRAREGYSGHVFVEVQTALGRVLIDSTSDRYLRDWREGEKIVPLTTPRESEGHYVLYRGVDPAGYGIRGIRQLNDAMDRFSAALREGRIAVHVPPSDVRRLPAP